MLESRQRLGGRAGSFTDPATGQLVDACQHVSMGCCTNLAHFFDTVGVGHLLAAAAEALLRHARTAGKACSRPTRGRPRSTSAAHLLGAHYLTPVEKLRVAWGMLALARAKPDADPPLLDWLLAHRQTRRTIDRFWGVVLVSALNETRGPGRAEVCPEGVRRRVPAPPRRVRRPRPDRAARPALRRRAAGVAHEHGVEVRENAGGPQIDDWRFPIDD